MRRRRRTACSTEKSGANKDKAENYQQRRHTAKEKGSGNTPTKAHFNVRKATSTCIPIKKKNTQKISEGVKKPDTHDATLSKHNFDMLERAAHQQPETNPFCDPDLGF